MDNYENSQKESDARRDRVRKRHEEWDKKEEESKPKKQTPTKTKEKIEENFETNVKDLNKHPISEWNEEKILCEFETYPNLRGVFFNISVNQPTMNLMIRISMGYEEEFKSQITAQLKKLRRMGLVEEVLVCESWWKNHLNKKFKLKIPISKVEHSILKKLILHKDTEERKKNNLIANSGFWLLTNRGKTIFTKAKQLIQQKEQESRKE